MRTPWGCFLVGFLLVTTSPVIEGFVAEMGGCECVPYYLCVNGTISTDGRNLIDIRIDDDTDCPKSIDLCCNKPDVINPTDFTTPAPTHHESTGCGHRNPLGVGFTITGGKEGEAQFGEFPWMVALLREEAIDGSDKRLNVHQCGGSLIHPQVVLTAAHCVANLGPNELIVRAGEWDTQTKDELYQHQDRMVRQVIVHEAFYAGTLYNDVALLILHDPVVPDQNVDTVCLPPEGEVFDHRRCFASGWGKDVFGREGKYQVILKRVEVPVVPQPECLASLKKTRLGPYFNLHESFICAGGEPGKDTCRGDGGSPLVCPTANDPLIYQQAGIVAWGIGCGEGGTPGVYVNIAHFRAWIDNQMAINNFDTDSYTS